MSFNTDDEDLKTQRKLFLFLGTLVGTVTAAVLFYAIAVDAKEHQTSQLAASEVVAEQPATADSQEIAEANGASVPVVVVASDSVVVMANDAESVVVEHGIVKFYFGVGKAVLAQGADEALKDVVAGVKNGQVALVSGFHDSTGPAEINEPLSKERALAVRDALLKLGVPEDKIELVKPQVLEGTGENAQARRVEVVLK